DFIGNAVRVMRIGSSRGAGLSERGLSQRPKTSLLRWRQRRTAAASHCALTPITRTCDPLRRDTGHPGATARAKLLGRRTDALTNFFANVGIVLLMTARGRKRKSSDGAHVFRFAPESGPTSRS